MRGFAHLHFHIGRVRPESSLAEGRLSVLTPVGSALLGQQAGTIARCRDSVGRTKTLTVLSVEPPNP